MLLAPETFSKITRDSSVRYERPLSNKPNVMDREWPTFRFGGFM